MGDDPATSDSPSPDVDEREPRPPERGASPDATPSPSDAQIELRAEEVVAGEIIEEAAGRAVVRAIQILQSEIFAGPLPHPDTLKGYEAVQPGLADRIVRMAESEQGHRHIIEDRTSKTEDMIGRRGLNYALVVALFGLLLAGILGLAGKTIAAGIIGGGDIVALASAFIVGRPRPSTSRAELAERPLQDSAPAVEETAQGEVN